MKKRWITISLLLVGMSLFFVCEQLAYAEDTATQVQANVGITFLEGSSDEQHGKETTDQNNHNGHSEKDEQDKQGNQKEKNSFDLGKQFPKTGGKNNFFFSLIGIILFLFLFIGIVYQRNSKEG